MKTTPLVVGLGIFFWSTKKNSSRPTNEVFDKHEKQVSCMPNVPFGQKYYDGQRTVMRCVRNFVGKFATNCGRNSMIKKILRNVFGLLCILTFFIGSWMALATM